MQVVALKQLKLGAVKSEEGFPVTWQGAAHSHRALLMLQAVLHLVGWLRVILLCGWSDIGL